MISFKDIKIVRILYKPYADWRKKKRHDQYLRSPDHYYLKTLRGIHDGKRCFIIGNGPSLCAADLDKLQNEYCFAANRIFKIFDQTAWRPSYYLIVDSKAIKEFQNSILKYDLKHIFLDSRGCTIFAPTNKLTRIYMEPRLFYVDAENHRFYNDKSLYVSEDVSDHFCNGQTVTYEAIQLAIYMGFKEIYLLGIDNNYSRVFDASGEIQMDPSVEDYFDRKRYYDVSWPSALTTIQYAYAIAREYCDTHGIVIRNATRGGKLEAFGRVNFDSLFESSDK